MEKLRGSEKEWNRKINEERCKEVERSIKDIQKQE